MLETEVILCSGTGSNGCGHSNSPELRLLLQLLTPAPPEGAVGRSLQRHSSANDWELALLLFVLLQNGPSFLVVIQSSSEESFFCLTDMSN